MSDFVIVNEPTHLKTLERMLMEPAGGIDRRLTAFEGETTV